MHPGLVELLSRWEARRSNGRPPRFGEIHLAELQPWLDHIGLVEVERAPTRFRIHITGAALARFQGADPSGLYLDELVPPAELRTMLLPYHACVATGGAVFDRLRFRPPGGAGVLLHRLLLPCTLRGDTVDVVIAALFADQRLH